MYEQEEGWWGVGWQGREATGQEPEARGEREGKLGLGYGQGILSKKPGRGGMERGRALSVLVAGSERR